MRELGYYWIVGKYAINNRANLDYWEIIGETEILDEEDILEVGEKIERPK